MEEFKRANEELIKMQAELAIKTKEEEKRMIEHQHKREALEHLKIVKVNERFKKKEE